MVIPDNEASSSLLNKRARASEPELWNDEVEQATGRAFDWECPFCGKDISDGDYYLAHVNPVGAGVGVVPGNILLTCAYCNQHMHQRHAQKYCMDKGIPFWHIQLKLEVLQKVCVVTKKVIQWNKAPDATQVAIAYFQEDPSRLKQKPSFAVAALKGRAGKSTVYKVWGEMQNE